MEKVWLKNYPQGVPATIDPDKYKSLGDMFLNSVHKFRDRPAYSNLGTVLGYAEVENLSRRFAAYLSNNAGLKKGDRIAIMMPNFCSIRLYCLPR